MAYQIGDTVTVRAIYLDGTRARRLDGRTGVVTRRYMHEEMWFYRVRFDDGRKPTITGINHADLIRVGLDEEGELIMKPLWRNLFGIPSTTLRTGLFGTLLVLTILLAAALFTAWGHEDSMLWNCYLMGNHQCGNADHILGFILGRRY